MQGNYFLRMMLPLQKLSGIFRHAIALIIATFFLQLFTSKWSIGNLAVDEIAHHAERERDRLTRRVHKIVIAIPWEPLAKWHR